jgi:signal transduction histidine kinase
MSSDSSVPREWNDALLELALHGQVMIRCRRALLHEIRNGLQPLHAGLEAISRAVTMVPFPADKAQRYVQLVRQASASQEIALERAVERIAPEHVSEESVDLATLLREVTRFLNSDAAVAGVRMQLDAPATAFVRGRPHQLRLIALCLTTDAIDRTGAEGQLSIAIHPLEGRVLLQFSDTRQQNPQAVDAATDQFHLQVIRKLVASMRGDMDCMHTQGAPYIVAITLPAGSESA